MGFLEKTLRQLFTDVMRRWLRRLGYVFIFIAWLLVMLFPVFAFQLATKGELAWGEETGRQVRVFLLQDKNAEGIGVQSTRPQPNSACFTTTVRYYMWVGEGQNSQYCQCLDGKACVSGEE